MTVSCEWCGSDVDPGSTCPRSLPCPHCGAAPGRPCKRPSGHRAPQLHAERVAQAENDDHARDVPWTRRTALQLTLTPEKENS